MIEGGAGRSPVLPHVRSIDHAGVRPARQVPRCRNGDGRSSTVEVARERPPCSTAPGQPSDVLMLTSQVMPKRSVHMPKTSPHICFSSGTETVPLPESASQ